ncbi:glucose-6-phosphate exchanger SLC37A2-like isoform X2 [Penaeus monodon]|uniref:glucose-6-phosphate exchanger SLC37A2-like isoform X2 n=1 Tax=Penaeus monodon TaxID=6687 RepID=UPI0018A756E1|nr:glucose-6-phosphate exchanger SLC37A2-like isoform X2 [Penaeus monodon]
MARLPLSIQAIESSCCVTVPDKRKRKAYSIWMWVLTFFIYCSYHLSRKPISVVKNVLNQNCTDLTPPVPNPNNSHWCDWKPFDKDNSATLLGMVDSSFLFAYAIGMFISGFIAERMDLRIFLSIGMIFSGIFCAMFGLGKSFNIHQLWFYIVAQILCGLMQTTGWPGVVTALGNWFGKGNRGLIFGIWNSHTSLGNILGTLIAAAFVSSQWSLSFIIPGIIIGSMGIITLFFMVPLPEMVGLPNPNANYEESPAVSYVGKEKEEETRNQNEAEEEKAISFFAALKIPGVVEFSLCLFFAKLVSYTFLYWLPNYILNNTPYSPEASANLSTFFDVGGIAGGILAGVLSDKTGMSASTCIVMLIVAIPMMFVYQAFCAVSLGLNIFLLLVVGLLVNGPYALITTAVSADLGTHECLKGNAKALATVTAIIDGTGSIGAAVGPLIAGPISEAGWDYVFYMLMFSDLFALILLLRLGMHEMNNWWMERRRRRNTLLAPI